MIWYLIITSPGGRPFGLITREYRRVLEMVLRYPSCDFNLRLTSNRSART